MKFTIDRKRWLRGGGGLGSFLFRESDGRMCCLGFFGLALGGTIEQISGKPEPRLTQDIKWPDWLFEGDGGRTSAEAVDLMKRNDTCFAPSEAREREREQEIAQIFAEHGVTVEFVD